MIRVFEGHPHIRVLETSGNPPDRYWIEFRILGLDAEGGGDPREIRAHRTEVFLPSDYPRRQPFCRMTTPVFHPNIDPQKICIGDHWSAGESLAALVVRIGQMICYQSYNVKSPLNAKAAAWAESHLHQLPLQEVDLTVGL
jgi:hypothetical protein